MEERERQTYSETFKVEGLRSFVRIGLLLTQTLLAARPGSGTQPPVKAFGYFGFENQIIIVVINIGYVRCSAWNCLGVVLRNTNVILTKCNIWVTLLMAVMTYYGKLFSLYISVGLIKVQLNMCGYMEFSTWTTVFEWQMGRDFSITRKLIRNQM